MSKSIIATLTTLLIASTSFVSNASPVGGTKQIADVVQPRDYDQYSMLLRGGEITMISIVGDGKADIDCELYDENKNLISFDRDATSECILSANPAWTGFFRLVIINTGVKASAYIGTVR
jgi:hypothetical protein